MIVISGRYRGPELRGSRIAETIASAIKLMQQIREPEFGGSLGKVPHVNAVFVVEGSLGSADFDLIRQGPYSPKDKCLQVDIAVSASDVNTKSLREVLVLGLRGANAVAFHFFEGKQISFPLRKAEELVNRLDERLEENGRGP